LRASAVSDAPLQRMRAVPTGCAFFWGIRDAAQVSLASRLQ
jgi:hypothetical protein